MATQERDPRQNLVFTALGEAQRRYELAEQIENPIERFFAQEQLLEEMDNLQADLEQFSAQGL